MSTEPEAVAARYARRAGDERYSLLRADVWQSLHERQRAIYRQFVRAGLHDLGSLRLIEIGCGAGGNLLDMLRLGLAAHNLCGIELLDDRLAMARRVLPGELRLIAGDALQADVPDASFDIVLIATVFSSLLDDAFQQRLADAAWRWLKPGGAVLWYDFVVDNPNNADVRGVPLKRLRALFPQAALRAQRITLAPPVARAVCRMHPALYGMFNALPLLRTHLLAWIEKPRGAPA
jgi:SAM-dependent methyltransferase